MPEFLANFSRLARPLSSTKNILLAFLALFLSGAQTSWPRVIISILSVSLVFSANYAFNTLSDFEEDRKSKNKQHYSKAIDFFGERKVILIFWFLAALGILSGLLINYIFVFCLALILAAGYLYSSRVTRFKEKAILDILISGVITISLRFAAFWFVFRHSLPPVTPILALISAKSGGYILYKEFDREFFPESNKNTIARLSKKLIVAASALLFFLAILFFIIMCFTGEIPFGLIFLVPLAIPPVSAVYLKVFNKIDIKDKNLRTIGFVYALLVLFLAYIIIK